MSDLLKTDDTSYDVEPNDKGVLLPKQFLKDYGCRNCVWKSFGQCPHDLEGDQSLPSGICPDLVDFFVSLADADSSLSSVKEKYMIYIQEMQTLIDLKDYHNLKQEYNDLRSSGADRHALQEIEMRMNAYKMWWHKLNESVVKGLSKIADRESRKKENDINVNHKISLTQLHQIINKAKEVKYHE